MQTIQELLDDVHLSDADKIHHIRETKDKYYLVSDLLTRSDYDSFHYHILDFYRDLIERDPEVRMYMPLSCVYWLRSYIQKLPKPFTALSKEQQQPYRNSLEAATHSMRYDNKDWSEMDEMFSDAAKQGLIWSIDPSNQEE